MADVFMSYHVKSASEIVKEIVTALEAREIGTGSARRNISCWYSGRDVPPGERWERRITQQIQNCCAFVPIIDHGAVESSFVNAEVSYAFSQYNKSKGKSISIIPYKWEDCDLGEDAIALYLPRFQTINAIPHTPQSLEDLIKAVVSAVEAVEKTKREQEEEEKLFQRFQTLLQENQIFQDQYQTWQEEKRALLRENQALREKNRALQEECQKLREQLSRRRHETPEAKIPEPSVSEIPKEDVEILAGISKEEQARRDRIFSDYDRARKEADIKASIQKTVSVMAEGAIIGKGRHSDVYRAELTGSKVPVALKVDNRNLLEEYPRVWEKVKALRGIENSHIQHLIEFVPDWEKNRSYMILEYVPGDTLQKLLYDRSQNGGAPFPQGRVLNWAFQILDALQYLHRHRLQHGDINLSNIMLRPNKGNGEDDICLIDFNWSAPDLEAGETRREIQSPDAPEETFFKVENAEAFRRGIRRDIYHVGMVMYYLLTGEVFDLDKGRAELLRGEQAADKAEKWRNLKAHGVTDDVAEVILKSISVEPAERYSSAKRMQDALAKLPAANRKIDKKSKHRKITALSRLCAVLGTLLILLGVYQLGAENGAKPEMSAQNETQVSDEALLPSALDGDR